MCVDDHSRPPLPPIRGSALDVRDVLLTSSNGAAFAAVLARAAGSPSEALDGAGVVILPDWRGLHPFYEELALRFAEASVHAVAVDPYGRTAGVQSVPPTSPLRSTSCSCAMRR